MLFKRGLPIILLAMIVIVLTGCGLAPRTGHTSTDAVAAQSFIPNLPGYTTYETTSIQQAITTAMGGAGVLTGNLVQAALVERIDTMVNCYRRAGAVDSRVYVEQLTNLETARLPVAGVLAVINEDRIRENFLGCISETPLDGLLGPQSLQPEPCYGSGTFTVQGNRISYLYAATDTPLCTRFSQYFAQYGG